jgi:hypothetical protein
VDKLVELGSEGGLGSPVALILQLDSLFNGALELWILDTGHCFLKLKGRLLRVKIIVEEYITLVEKKVGIAKFLLVA